MNTARERLQFLISIHEKHAVDDEDKAKTQCLKNLDALIADMVQVFADNCERNNNGIRNPALRELEDRARKLGYGGEK